MGFPNRELYDGIFREISETLRNELPSPLRDFDDKTKHGDNWIKLKYPGRRLPNCQYELQFTGDRSKTHTHHFGPGEKTVIGVYYGGKQIELWLKEMMLHKPEIERQLGQEVKETGGQTPVLTFDEFWDLFVNRGVCPPVT